MKFIDEVSIIVESGKGGPGSVSFRREALVPRGGPDGGDGGKGGDVIFRVDTGVSSLLDLKIKRHYKAGDGEPGQGQNRSGANGGDLVIKVPEGTVVKSNDGEILADLSKEGDFTFLHGGLGGKGNTFYKSSVNQAPTVAQKGLPGESREIQLELKLLADVGIIGYPNVGKSTLISRISAAKPKVADYPFTTLVPNLGVVRVDVDRSFVVADIPGLISGAHQGVGLGVQFLRHIERTRLFVHLIDASGMSARDALQDYKDIQYELEQYDEQKKDEDGFVPLLSRPQILVLNKTEIADKEELEELIGQFKKMDLDPLSISAVTGLNIQKLIFMISEKLKNMSGEPE